MRSDRSGKVLEYVIIGLSLLGLVAMGSLVSGLKKDTSIDAFMSDDHPAVVSRDNVEKLFGLRDPIVIALIDEGENALFDPESLNLLHWLTVEAAKIPNVDPERVTSLASATKIIGEDDTLFIEPFYDRDITTSEEAAEIRSAVEQMPVYWGTLVARDGRGAIISIELIDQSIAAETYENVLALIERAPAGGSLHVAGEAAVSGFLSEYVNRDSRKLVPLGFLAVFVIIFLAFRTTASLILSFIVVAASVVSALGFMAAAGVPYFVITNAMPSILVGVSVADSVHIMSAYYEAQGVEGKDADRRMLARKALRSIWRPVLFTTVTTIFGFLGIVGSSSMPPMFWFGVFAIVGLLFALLYSILFLPAGLALLARAKSGAFKTDFKNRTDTLSKTIYILSSQSANNPVRIIGAAFILFFFGVIGAMNIKVDREQIGQFKPGEAIVRADEAINAYFNGSNTLNIVVEANTMNGVLTYSTLSEMKALQDFALDQPHVHGATSIVDYILQLNGALDNSRAGVIIPEDSDLLAQQFFLLTAGGGPTEWEDEIDALQQRALIKIQVSSGRYSDSRIITEQLQDYIDTIFNSDDRTAYISGRMHLDYHWLKPLAREHATSIAISLTLVLLAAMALFRSVKNGLFTIAPVVLSITTVYAVMGYFGVWLDAATSMFATIAIGLGVDFGIHAIDRINHYRQARAVSLDDALKEFSATSGRALFVNFLAIFSCFCIIASSELPTMERFGGICALAILVSFLASITVVPALLALSEQKEVAAGARAAEA